jgi:hypothetical protein
MHREPYIDNGIRAIVDINDAIMAATAVQTGGRIFCLNRKHYPMPDLLVKKAW